MEKMKEIKIHRKLKVFGKIFALIALGLSVRVALDNLKVNLNNFLAAHSSSPSRRLVSTPWKISLQRPWESANVVN
jgi:hypothetical protein